MQRNNLVCTGTPDVRSCGEFLATSEFQALNMSFGVSVYACTIII